jgi:hypothetical protein
MNLLKILSDSIFKTVIYMPSRFSLVLNNSNVVANSNNSRYQYNFIGGNFKTKNARICVSQVTVPYSWFNISPQWSNQQITFGWTNGGTPTSTTITIPQGFYSTADLNNYLQQYMISIGAYLINASGQYVFYAAIVQNQTYYANQLVLTLVPTSLPSGFTTPSGFAGFPTVATTPQIAFPASNSVGSVLGFAPSSSYGFSLSNVSQLSTQTPVATNVNSLIVHCNLANNPVTMPSDILDSIPIVDTTFGANINYSPSFEKWISITDGTYNSLLITLTDENNVNLVAQDNHSLFTLVLETE